MIGRTNTGGGVGLNFRICGGTSAPSSPKENDIWVNTNTKITSYIFSVSEPVEPAEGMVWVSVGDDSSVSFNALKKNEILICPVAVKQYVGGAWAEKVAKTYQGGTWKEWRVYIYNSGDLCTSITGGWTSTAVKDGYLRTYADANTKSPATTMNTVPSGKYKKLSAECMLTSTHNSGNGSFSISVTSTKDGGTVYKSKATATSKVEKNEKLRIDLDISDVDKDGYIRLTGNYATVEWYKIWFE
jgi:hypothetical protein